MKTAHEIAETFYKTPALVSHRVRCGKPGCRCRDGAGHGPYWFLRWREGHIQRRCYVQNADVATVRAIIARRRADDRALRLARKLAWGDLGRMGEWLQNLDTD